MLNQTYPQFEIIIINDGSTDHSEKVIIEKQHGDARIRYIKQENCGVSVSRNIGIEQASGKYICFLDADDFLDSNFLEKMYGRIIGYDVCYCGQYYVFPDNKRKKSKMQFVTGDILTPYFYNRCTPNTNSWMLRKDFIDKHQIRFTEGDDWGEDMLFFAKILTLNTEVQCVREYLTNYNRGVENSLSTNDIKKLYNDIEWISQFKAYIQSSQLPARRKRKVMTAINGYYLPALVIYRLKINKPLMDKAEYQKIREDLSNNLLDFSMNNGLRSLKLYVYSKFI